MSKDFEPEVYQRTNKESYAIRDKNNGGYLDDTGHWGVNPLQCWPTREAAQKVADDYVKRRNWKERKKRAGEIFEDIAYPQMFKVGPPTLPQRVQEVCRSLEGVTPEEQERVLKAAILLLGLRLPSPKPKEEPEAAKTPETPTVTPSWLSGLRAEVVYAVQNGASPVKVTQLFDEYVARTRRNG